MFAIVMLFGAVFSSMAAPKAIAQIGMFGVVLDGWKAKRQVGIYKAAKDMGVDISDGSEGELYPVDFPEDMFPPEYSYAGGSYRLTKEELFNLYKVMEAAIDDAHPVIDGKEIKVDLGPLVAEYKRRTKLRTEGAAAEAVGIS